MMAGGSRTVNLISGNRVVEKDKEIKELTKKLNFHRRQNDEHLKKQFEQENQIRWLTERLGFASAQEAETQLADSDITLLQLQEEYDKAISRIRDLEEDALVHAEAFHRLREDHEEAKRRIEELEDEVKELNQSRQWAQSDNETQFAELNLQLHEKDSLIAQLQVQAAPFKSRLLSPLGKENSPPTSSSFQVPTSSFVLSSPMPSVIPKTSTPKKDISPSAAAFLQAQLTDLQERYDSLLRIYRENVQQRTKEKKVWKEFKEAWAANNRKVAKAKKPKSSETPRSPVKRRKVTPAEQRTPTRAPTRGALSPQGIPQASQRPVAAESLTQYEDESLPPSQADNANQPAATPPRNHVLVAASSETDLEENKLSHPLSAVRPISNIHQVTASTTVNGNIPNPEVSTPRPFAPRLSAADLPKRQMLEEVEGDRTFPAIDTKGKAPFSPRTTRRPISEGSAPALKTPLGNLPRGRDERARALRELNKLPKDQYLDQYKSFKGHGRYSGNLPKPGEEGINARYEIDRGKNGGMDYQFDSVVRNKEARKQMHGVDCPCCREYYEAVGPVPAALQAPLWKTPSSKKRKYHATSAPPSQFDLEEGTADITADAQEAVKQKVSRHREVWHRPNTPPGYWEIGFPTTQQARQINRQAEEMHREKERQIEQEAERGGRYKRRS